MKNTERDFYLVSVHGYKAEHFIALQHACTRGVYIGHHGWGLRDCSTHSSCVVSFFPRHFYIRDISRPRTTSRLRSASLPRDQLAVLR